MRCAWQAYLNLLPEWLRKDVNHVGKETLQELRLRIGQVPELIPNTGNYYFNRQIVKEDIEFSINAASQYSPWSATTIADGFITAQGGHRIGICGDMSLIYGRRSTIHTATSLCIRVARDFPGIAAQLSSLKGSMLIIGSPGRGKTTLLRDLIRQKSMYDAVSVIDERKELFPFSNNQFCFPVGMRTDILSGCKKTEGIELLIRSMSPSWIAVDEITAESDCQALIRACWCGVNVLATAHAENMSDFMNRPVYKSLITLNIFHNFIIMQDDKSWKMERMTHNI